jgi:hypothetical protein
VQSGMRREHDVAGFGVEVIDAVPFESGEEEPHFRPVILEQLPHRFAPLGQRFGGKLRTAIKVHFAKVQQERRRDDGHFDHKQFIVEIN